MDDPQPLGLAPDRDGLICIPPGYQDGVSLPLLVMLHGAGNGGAGVIPMLRPHSDAAGVILLAPDSRGRTWDTITGRAGPDVDFLNLAVRTAFARFALRRDRVALAGFSDGGSYALSVGLANGSLFRHIMAFSPGFLAPLGREGAPHVFMAHGTADPVLPIESCSRTIRQRLLHYGYDVTYQEFNGGHIVPAAIVQSALTWWLG